MNTITKIPVKMLAEMALASFCPRCFWRRLRCRNLPYQKFAGISMILDGYTKKIVREHYSQYGTLPRWFDGFGKDLKPVPVPHHSKFFWMAPETGIQLTGAPDEILEMSDGFGIVDYKTARWTDRQSEMLPLYRVQVNGYAQIAEACGYVPVVKLGLMYFEPQALTELEDGLDTALATDGFTMRFCPRFLEVECRPQDILPPLLNEARRLLDLPEPPPPAPECDDCRLLEQLIDQPRSLDHVR